MQTTSGHPLPGRRLHSNLPRGDFVHEKLSNGRSYKILTVLDEYTRQALAVTVRNKMSAEDVLEALNPLLLRYGTPEYIRSDIGPEFVAEAMQSWLVRVWACFVAVNHSQHHSRHRMCEFLPN